jgi:DNA-binding transcriptional regulator YhcF (GntR family)
VQCLAPDASAHVDAYVDYGPYFEIYEVLREMDPELWELNNFFALIGRSLDPLVNQSSAPCLTNKYGWGILTLTTVDSRRTRRFSWTNSFSWLWGVAVYVKVKKEDNDIIDRGTLADQAFNYLSRAILNGEFRTRDRLVEDDLSEKLGISRAPLREALTELVRQGLAYNVVRRGTFVTPWTKQDLWEVAVLRSTLEELVSELAAPHITDEDIAFLEQVIAEMTEAVSSIWISSSMAGFWSVATTHGFSRLSTT